MQHSQTASLASQGAATTPLAVDTGKYFDVSVKGTFTGTVSLQRSFDGGNTWGTMTAYTAPAEASFGPAASDAQVRLSMTAYTSGAASALVGYGD